MHLDRNTIDGIPAPVSTSPESQTLQDLKVPRPESLQPGRSRRSPNFHGEPFVFKGVTYASIFEASVATLLEKYLHTRMIPGFNFQVGVDSGAVVDFVVRRGGLMPMVIECHSSRLEALMSSEDYSSFMSRLNLSDSARERRIIREIKREECLRGYGRERAAHVGADSRLSRARVFVVSNFDDLYDVLARVTDKLPTQSEFTHIGHSVRQQVEREAKSFERAHNDFYNRSHSRFVGGGFKTPAIQERSRRTQRRAAYG